MYLVKETAVNRPFMWCRGVWEGIQDFPPHFGWAGWLPWAQVRNSLLLGLLSSTGYTWAGGLWLTRFPRGQALLMGRTRCILKFLSSSYQEHKRIFLWYLLWELCWAPGDKCHNKIGASLWLNPRRPFTSQACLLWASSNLSVTVQISYPGQLVTGTSAHEFLLR